MQLQLALYIWKKKNNNQKSLEKLIAPTHRLYKGQTYSMYLQQCYCITYVQKKKFNYFKTSTFSTQNTMKFKGCLKSIYVSISLVDKNHAQHSCQARASHCSQMTSVVLSISLCTFKSPAADTSHHTNNSNVVVSSQVVRLNKPDYLKITLWYRLTKKINSVLSLCLFLVINVKYKVDATQTAFQPQLICNPSPWLGFWITVNLSYNNFEHF